MQHVLAWCLPRAAAAPSRRHLPLNIILLDTRRRRKHRSGLYSREFVKISQWGQQRPRTEPSFTPHHLTRLNPTKCSCYVSTPRLNPYRTTEHTGKLTSYRYRTRQNVTDTEHSLPYRYRIPNKASLIDIDTEHPAPLPTT